MHNWVAGEEITAAKLNQLNPEADNRISQAEHNILELYLENYFANKITPFQGLMFDGFDDTSKTLIETGLVSQALAGQAIVTLGTLSDYNQFLPDDTVQIYDDLHQEVKKISGKNINNGAVQYSENDLASFTYTETDPNNAMTDNGVVSGQREQRWTALGAGDDDAPRNQKYSKTFNVTSGVVYTIAVDKAITQNDAGIAGQFETQIFVDGVLKASVGGGGSGTMTVTATAAGATMLVEYKTRKIVIPGNGGYAFKFAWSNFLVTYTSYEITCDSNFAFSYFSGTLLLTDASLSTWAYAENELNGDQWHDDGLVSGKRRVRQEHTSNAAVGSYGEISKTFTGQRNIATVVSVVAERVVVSSPNNYKTEMFINGSLVETKTWGAGAGGIYTFNQTVTISQEQVTVLLRTTVLSSSGGASVDNFNFSNFQLNRTSNFTPSLKTTSASLGGRLLQMTAGAGDLKRVIYQMIPAVFTQLMATITLWIARKITVALNPNASVASGATTIAQQGTTGSFAIGDTMDIYTADKTVRERKTVTNVVESGGGSVIIDQVTSDLSSSITRSFAHTVNVHNNRVLVVAINCFSSNNGGGLIPTGITYNGVEMTLQVSGNNGNGRNGLSFWKLLNPATGTNNLVVTYATAPSSVNSSSRVTVIGFYNARDTTAGQNFGFVVNAWTKSINSETNGFSIDLCGNDLGNPSQSPGGGQTVQSSDNFRGWCSTLASTGVTTNMGGSNGGYEGNYMGISVLPTLPLLTLTFSPAVIRGAGFSTSDFFERVDVFPKISVGANGAPLSYLDLTYVQSVDMVIDTLTYTEDEYIYTPGTPNQKIGVRVDITRSNTGFAPNAKRLGLSLNT